MKTKIKEIIVVEGRNDTNAINRAINGQTIETHGFGITKETLEGIKKAYSGDGIIIFTDPDYAGMKIRRRLKSLFPKAKEAFLEESDAFKKGDIGIENASPEAIHHALQKARAEVVSSHETFTIDDMIENGLKGLPNSSIRRKEIGKVLGIGYGNSKAFLKKLNNYNISRKEFDEAIQAQHRW